MRIAFSQCQDKQQGRLATFASTSFLSNLSHLPNSLSPCPPTSISVLGKRCWRRERSTFRTSHQTREQSRDQDSRRRWSCPFQDVSYNWSSNLLSTSPPLPFYLFLSFVISLLILILTPNPSLLPLPINWLLSLSPHPPGVLNFSDSTKKTRNGRNAELGMSDCCNTRLPTRSDWSWEEIRPWRFALITMVSTIIASTTLSWV